MNTETNLAELSWQVISQLSTHLNLNQNWRRISESFGGEFAKSENIAALERLGNPSENLIRQLGNRLHTIGDLLRILDQLRLEKAQLVLRRKFKPVKVVSYSPSSREIVLYGDDANLRCVANGFPYPRYQWYRNGEPVDDGNRSELIVDGKNSTLSGSYHCRVWNEIEDGESWSSFYRKPNKEYQSAWTGEPIEVTLSPMAQSESARSPHLSKAAEMESLMKRIHLVLNDEDTEGPSSAQTDRSTRAKPPVYIQAADVDFDDCIATDKVALIVCNSEYVHLPKLHTPACDAETLAEKLLTLNFKTVTLADLTLSEMKRMMDEYKKLLGRGVYALFYFVGHGFETRGQCYLLPIDAPSVNYKCRDCLCAEEALVQMQETEPSLNVILLDICRRFPPHDAHTITDSAVQFKPRVNRNTVFGYATSLGEGAYEVRGEMNGIFMKYFKNSVCDDVPVTEVLHRVMRALENDAKAGDVQFPEIRTNLARPRSLKDVLIFAGHTETFDFRTYKWQEIHALPDPVKVHFGKYNLMVTVWFDFCGHFTNMIYVFTSVCSIADGMEPNQDEVSMEHLAFLTFPQDLDSTQSTVCEDSEEGVSVRTLLRHLQRLKGPLVCELRLHNRKIDKVIAVESKVILGELLIAKLEQYAA